MNITKY